MQLHSKNVISDLIDFFQLDGDSLRSKFEREDGQTGDCKWHVPLAVKQLGPPRNHARSRSRFEMFMISRNCFVGDLP